MFQDAASVGNVVSTHSHPKVAGHASIKLMLFRWVSTHSHPKVAGYRDNLNRLKPYRFNTQPPEGGWFVLRYNHGFKEVSTHSHPKVAGSAFSQNSSSVPLFQHTATRRWLV